MKNPYEIINISHNSKKKEIIKGSRLAMKNKTHTMQEIDEAKRHLLDPSLRLMVDFIFPSNTNENCYKLINIEIQPEEIDLSSLDNNAFNTLKS